MRGRNYDGAGLPEDLDDEIFYLCQEERITYLEALRTETFPTLSEGLECVSREKEDHGKLLGRLSARDLLTYAALYADCEFADKDLFTLEGNLDEFEQYLADKWGAESKEPT